MFFPQGPRSIKAHTHAKSSERGNQDSHSLHTSHVQTYQIMSSKIDLLLFYRGVFQFKIDRTNASVKQYKLFHKAMKCRTSIAV